MNFKPHDYKCIAIWGNETGSYTYYIREQQQRAAAAGAPLTALFERNADDGSGRTGVWCTLEELNNTNLQSKIIRRLAVLAAEEY